MSVVAVIAEKPSVASNLASVLGATNRKDGYFEGNNYIVTFAFGHLMQLWDAKEYNQNWAVWNVDNLPIFPDQFKYKVADDSGVKKQIKVIKEIFNRPDVTKVINSCDADREGQLIFETIFHESGSKKPVEHLWISSHTPKDVEEGFHSLRSDSAMKSLQHSAYCRQWADWLWGINFTVATTKIFSRDKTILKVGRVILPTVYLIYKRDMEIKHFVPKDFFQLKTRFKANAGEYEGLYISNEKVQFENRATLDEILKKIQGRSGTVKQVKTKESRVGSLKLFNLSDLQGHMSANFQGFTADKVLKIAQSLYEKRFTTYPRTESRHLDDTQRGQAKEALNSVKSFFPQAPISFDENNPVFNSSKVESHPAIDPTYMKPKEGELSPDELQVYMEIVKRFVSQFMPFALYEQTEILTNIEGHDFITKGSVLINPGWKVLYGKEPEAESEDESTLAVKVTENEAVSFVKSNVLAKQTKPPKPYTIQTLLKAMETCGKEENEEVLPGYTVGTAATRAEIIKKVQEVGYVKASGKTLRVTEMGVNLMELFPIKPMLEPAFTGKIERALKEIENGKYSEEAFMNQTKEMIKKGIEIMRGTKGEIGKAVAVLGKCPECGKDVIEGSKSYSCIGYKDQSCKFSIWKEHKLFESMKKKLTASMVKNFLAGKVVAVKGCTSKSGKTYDAKLKFIKQDNGYWGFTFEK